MHAQVTLALRRPQQCEEFLALATLLAARDGGAVSHALRAALHRCYGQLYAAQVGVLSWKAAALQ